MPPDDLNGIDDELFPTVVLQQQQQQQEANSSRNLRRNLSEEAKKKTTHQFKDEKFDRTTHYIVNNWID